MSKAGNRILASISKARAHTRGEATEGFVVHVPPPSINVRYVRRKLGMTQIDFANTFGFELKTLRNWEQGRREPMGTARAFLKVIEKRPDAVREALLEA